MVSPTKIGWPWLHLVCGLKSLPLLSKIYLLIYDGHLEHVSIEVIQKSIAGDTTIVKSRHHLTNKFQPLDVCYFSLLKCQWESLIERVNTLRLQEIILKSIFADLLCSIWTNNCPFKIQFQLSKPQELFQ